MTSHVRASRDLQGTIDRHDRGSRFEHLLYYTRASGMCCTDVTRMRWYSFMLEGFAFALQGLSMSVRDARARNTGEHFIMIAVHR